MLTKEPAGQVLLGAAQHDPEVAVAFGQRFLEPQRRAERALLERGIAAGDFPAGLTPDATLDALVGPIYFRALTGARIAPAFIDGLLSAPLGT